MIVEWNAIATIAAPIIALVLGAWLNRRSERRPRLVSYYGHVSSFRHTLPDDQLMEINTHAVVIKNTGHRSATNVRLSHAVLPEFNILPALQYTVDTLPNGAQDIVIPTLVPDEEVTVSYLYLPPLTFEEVNSGIRHDQGFAQPIPVLLQRQYPQWFNRIAATLVLVGAIAVLYGLYEVARWATTSPAPPAGLP